MKRNSDIHFIIFFIVLILGVPGFAKEANVLTQGERYSVSGYPLSLDEAIRYTLQNNFTIEIARLERKINSYAVQSAKSIYDTTFTAEFGYTVDEEEKTSTILPEKSNTTVWNLGLSKRLPTGTALSFDFLNTRNSAPSLFTALNPYYMSDMEISVTQPILKNGFGFLDRGSVRLVQLDVSRLDLALLSRIENDIAAVIRTYWALGFAYGNLRSSEEALEYAEEFLRITREQYENGALEETDLFAAKANVEQRKKEILQARAAISDASDDLKLAMNFFPEFDLYTADEPNLQTPSLDSVEQTRVALENRRDLRQAHIALEAQKLDIQMKKNSLWPQLDLIGSFVSNGLDRDMIDAVGEIMGMDDPTYFIGAQFSFPLENRKARSDFAQADLEKAKALVTLKQVEKSITNQVGKTLRALRLAQERISHNKKIIEFQEKKLAGEEKKYGFGRSSSDIILRYENDVINARIAYLQSLYDHATFRVNLRQEQNILLNDVDWITYETIEDGIS